MNNTLTIDLKTGRFATPLRTSVAALVLTAFCPMLALAQEDHVHGLAPQHEGLTNPDPAGKASALLQIVRNSTERFKNVAVAEASGYALQFGCVSGPDSGAMGLHYVNGDLVKAGEIDPTRPQIVIYEAQPDGSLQLIGADFLVMAAAWNAKHSGPPELMGQLFHLFNSPNRFGLDAFYTLHVWAWKQNPKGAFVNWHPNVSCETFGGEKQ